MLTIKLIEKLIENARISDKAKKEVEDIIWKKGREILDKGEKVIEGSNMPPKAKKFAEIVWLIVA